MHRILILLAAMAAANTAPAGTIVVPDQYPTIQSAIDAALSGDEVVLQPGTYAANLQFKGKNLTLRSTDPASPAVVAPTVIDGNATGPAILFQGIEDATTLVDGLTLTNGRYPVGGGMAGNNCRARIRRCDIHQNVAPANSMGTGGGIAYLKGEIRGCTIHHNQAYSGGGIGRCEGLVVANDIYSNSCAGQLNMAEIELRVLSG